jgi:hypothetical protein
VIGRRGSAQAGAVDHLDSHVREIGASASGLATLAAMVLVSSLAGCRVDQSSFEARVFTCDTSAQDPGCGSDQDGQPMLCYPASQLAGVDFCAQTCGDTPMSLPDQDAVCVQGGAKLKYCDPPADGDSSAECGPNLACLRTDITSQEGVCIDMTTCQVDTDCRDPVRSTCVATFLKDLYTQNANLQADNLYCLQKNCQSGESSCSPGESCLPLLVPPGSNAPDICVPNCDSQGRCPPNHFCFQKISGPANPAICIPGLLGFICETDIDCLVGACRSDGDPNVAQGLKLCTLPCNSDTDCTIFDSNQGMFVCQADADGSGKHCATPNAYRGNSCHVDAECTRDVGTVCVYQTPPTSASDLGTCLRPCAAGACAPRAGIGEACLSFFDVTGNATAACFPGFFGTPCADDTNCVGDLKCRQIPGVPLTRCTTPCQIDADCAADRWSAGQSFCANSLCTPLLPAGADCASDSQCQSKLCPPVPAGTAAAQTCAAGATP